MLQCEGGWDMFWGRLAQVPAGQSRADEGQLYCMHESALVPRSIKSKLAIKTCHQPFDQSMARCLACIQGLKALLTTLIISLPAFYNVGALLMLVFFMYSYVAVLLFGSIQPQAAINDHANFSNFGKQAQNIPLQYVLVGALMCRHTMQGKIFEGCHCMSILRLCMVPT